MGKLIFIVAIILIAQCCYTDEDKRHNKYDNTESIKTLREIGYTMQECRDIAREANDALNHCTKEYHDCVESLRECRDTTLECALLVERVTGIPIPRTAKDGGK